MKVPFAGGSYSGVSPAANAQKCVNFYLENDLHEVDEQGNPKKLLIGTPGLTLYATMPNSGAIRALYAFSTTAGVTSLYVVANTNLYEIDSSGVVHLRGGGLDAGTSPVYMADNGQDYGHQIIITTGFGGYIYDTVAFTLTKITDASFFTNPGPVIQMNSWFICCSAVDLHETIRLSKLGDGTTWTPLQEAAADAEYDEAIGLAKDGNKLLIFGKTTLEVWWNTGNADFPFQRMGDGVFYIGCAAPHSIARAGGMICWLGTDNNGGGQVMALDGAPVVISTPNIEWQIKAAVAQNNLKNAIAYGYHDAGHDFYVLTFPFSSGAGGDITFVYDFTTKEWHQRSTGTTGTTYHRHIGNCHAFIGLGTNINSGHFIGDYQSTGKVYQMSSSAFDDAGTAIIRDRIGVHFNRGNERIKLKRAGFVFGGNAAQSGVGSTSTLQWSTDRGITWSTARNPDKIEDGLSYWEQLGQARDWLFWLRCSSSTEQCVVTDAVLEPKEN